MHKIVNKFIEQTFLICLQFYAFLLFTFLNSCMVFHHSFLPSQRLQCRQPKARIFKTLSARECFYFYNMINPGSGSTIFLTDIIF